jgi:cation:H+ antiporter
MTGVGAQCSAKPAALLVRPAVESAWSGWLVEEGTMMDLLRFEAFAPGGNALLFSGASALVWYASTRLTRYATALSDRLGGHQALIGTLLLGGMVSLPEMATSVSAAALGNAPLALNTLLGGIAVTMAILAIVDMLVGWEPLSIDVAHPIVLVQGTLVVVFLTIAAAGILLGDRPIPGTGIGVWTSVLLLLYLVCVQLIRRYERSEPWVPRRVPHTAPAAAPSAAGPAQEPHAQTAMGVLIVKTLLASLVILVAGFLLASTGEALAAQTGLGASFVGLVLGGLATSLPELSTALSAVRLRHYEMAFADAFGTNLCSIMLLFCADAAYPRQLLLNEAGRFALFAILLGIAVTAVYLLGLILRRNYSILRMGLDSVLVLVLYAGGVIVLFHLR